jgi:hypothetical protein
VFETKRIECFALVNSTEAPIASVPFGSFSGNQTDVVEWIKAETLVRKLRWSGLLMSSRCGQLRHSRRALLAAVMRVLPLTSRV